MASAVCWLATGFTALTNQTFSTVSLGTDTHCGLDAVTGEAVCWGEDQAGEGSPPPGAFESISVGSTFSCGIRPGGLVERGDLD